MDEITRLVESLGSGGPAEDEQALALLALHGRKAVEPLLAAASSPEAARRAAAVVALGRLADPRGRRAVTLALADRSPQVRAAGATALAGYPSEAAVARLRGMLERESEAEVRMRAAATLVDMFNAGTVEALDPLLSLAQDRAEDRRVRLEALQVLGSLPAGEARALASGLIADPDPRMAAAAGRYAGRTADDRATGAAEALEELDSPDYFTYRRAASLLASLGAPAIPLLVRALRARAADPAACARVASVLREVARGREREVARHLEEVESAVPLGLLVDVVGASRDRTALYHLKGVIDRLSSSGAADDDGPLARAMIAAKAHHYLARAGSRVAYDQLRDTLARHDQPLLNEVLLAVEEIGGREDLPDLAARHAREQGWMRERVREAFRRVVSRARIRPDDPALARLAEKDPARLAELLAPEPRPADAGGLPARRRVRRVDTAGSGSI
ncbi:MAG TPA: HEAT repeat domain-containing protein [Candidatus Polarisedimenticolia bacterium]|nr:HEAT repeat domain-containing protein [Candidatus Polarisedimenticolia bacterium]